jgi:hypothetical protein
MDGVYYFLIKKKDNDKLALHEDLSPYTSCVYAYTFFYTNILDYTFFMFFKFI